MPIVQQRANRLDPSTFFGVPITGFEAAGRQQFILLLLCGLEPSAKVVDIGCGVLRAGYWLIHFLDPHCYHGIEPHAGRLKTGQELILEPETIRAKEPRFDTNANFDTSVFGTKFDLFLAYSIWTHASRPQISAMLDHFLRDSEPDAMFLTSVLPARWWERSYRGTAWVGTSHESNMAGCIRHSMRWLRDECRRRGLHLHILGRERDGQTWLQISRKGTIALPYRTIWSEPLWTRVVRRVLRRLISK